MQKEIALLHTHTKMPVIDGTTSVTELITRTAELGYPAVAITDHGDVQTFPKAMRTAPKCRKDGKPIKVIYGMEACLASDTKELTLLTIIDGAEEQLTELVISVAHKKYGYPLPQMVEKRLKEELDIIIKNDYATLFWNVYLQVKRSKEQGYPTSSRGSVGALFVAYLAGISDVNPLPPHYHCSNCGYFEIPVSCKAGSGYDLPKKDCSKCGHSLTGDGQNIPWETFFGLQGEKVPDIDINFASAYLKNEYAYLKELFQEGQVVIIGTIPTLHYQSALNTVRRYVERCKLDEEQKKVLTNGIEGGMFIIPKSYEAEDFTPLQRPNDDMNNSAITKHLNFYDLQDTILEIDALAHYPTYMCHLLEKFTGLSMAVADLSDPLVYRAFSSADIRGLPDFGTNFVRKLLSICKPSNFSELVKISGLNNGNGIWTFNAEKLLENNSCSLSDVISSREDIYNTLVENGIDRAEAFKIMENIDKEGSEEKLTEAQVQMILDRWIPEWYIKSDKKTDYFLPKAHAVEYTLLATRCCWFKIYHPVEFYAARLTIIYDRLDYSILTAGTDAIREEVKRLEYACAENIRSAHLKFVLRDMELVLETALCGIRFLSADLQHSSDCEMLPEKGNIRLPLIK